jgi:ribosomal protein S18 acetylase RimI-like enzyme
VVSSASAEVVVREAVSSDAVAIAALGPVAFAELHTGVLPDALIDLIVQETYSVESLRACIARCAGDDGAHFLVAHRWDALVGYLHYDSEAREPELHRIYVDPLQKRAGIGSALMREHHARLPSGASYILLVFAANAAAIDFYRAHRLKEDARVDAYPFFSENPGVTFPPDTRPLPALVMRFTDSACDPPLFA